MLNKKFELCKRIEEFEHVIDIIEDIIINEEGRDNVSDEYIKEVIDDSIVCYTMELENLQKQQPDEELYETYYTIHMYIVRLTEMGTYF